ncbi:alpha/beta fold hydrolase [Leptospira haakeii]|uniref:Alpha/beta hydrolase n=1 Tax=Leptospira haakeii TaxID=2023198 RepID=A0ABX4PS59_9LEPT|nr:alpha/beta hydrolase [Leptospira haakeii]PKA17726.1 alpha/beta hydrolase [Leptospira haakeii]PKA21451.1 alpha/beta hydrolase [Leptospira haakeii]
MPIEFKEKIEGLTFPSGFPEVRSKYIDANGQKFFLLESGPKDGKPLLLLHGFPEFSYAWKNQIGYFAELGYLVIAPDQRGYARSSKPKSISDYGLDILSEDIISILDTYGISKTDIIAHDWGGAVAYWTLSKFPERFRKACILNVPHPTIMKRKIISDKAQRKKSMYILFFRIPWLPEFLLSRLNFRKLERSLTKTSMKGAFSPEEISLYKEVWAIPGCIKSMLHWYRAAVKNPPKLIRTRKIKIPTRIFWGEKDRFLAKEMAEETLELFSDASVRFFSKGTHWIHHEIPEILNPELASFLLEE